MMINEPLTLATDYMLAAASIVFGSLLLRMQKRFWALAFFFTAAGSFFGGTYHGFGGVAWWKLTTYSIGLASLFLLFAVTVSRAVRVGGVLLFVSYAIWMASHDSFAYVIIDYGLTLIAITVLQIVEWTRFRAESARWIIASVAVSVIAAIAQRLPIAYHNDIYHVIQLVALWLLYRGGAIMRTATSPLTTRPT
jgi:hypothetical protein